MEDYLSKFNEPQRQAVTWLDGPELVIAGAGSGKTRVLTYKIVHLLAHGYEPWRIMALTFTNKAAREMRERIEQLAGPEIAGKLWMGTFHSIFARILRVNADRIGYRSDYTIYDGADSKSLVKMIIKDMNLDEKLYKPAAVLSSISMAKNALISPEAYIADRDIMEADRRARRSETAAIYRHYRDRCHVNNAMDFDDLLYNTNVLLRDNPDILRHYQEYFRYILVDEYQDTNFAQHLIVSQLCSATENLCVVGDDAQSIYSFRGANIRNILNLKQAYPRLSIFKLEQNYRSTRNIINAANSLIAKNSMQIPKEVFSKNAAGDRVEVVKCYSDLEEATLVASRISQVKMASHDSYEEFAVLYRTNAQSRVLEEALRRRNIPYRIYGGLAFYQRKEIKDAVAYFRLAVNPDDDEALKRVINTPARGIGETTLKKLVSAAIQHRVSIWQVLAEPLRYPVDVNKGTRLKLEGFITLVKRFIEENHRGVDADFLARMIIADTRLMAMLVSDTTPESISKRENLEELLRAAAEFVSDRMEQEGAEADTSMQRFLTEVSLATDQDMKDAADGESQRITLMTIHAAKGLEFSNVFIVGVEEELLPSAMSMSSAAEIEEERRLLYVALTRAKNFCMMTYAASRYINGQTKTCSPSRFLNDIDSRLLNFRSGSAISRPPELESFRQSYHSHSGAKAYSPPQSTDSLPQKQASATSPATAGVHVSGELSPGMRVAHFKFGEGTIISVDTSQPDHRITVQFNNAGRRVLLLKFAKFEIIS
ncbi:MAG: UvrD-helicase domain-containing protein [Muribaculaceae bacterium]|nr:UvrD-helicase domain-containing protein [Muribaculaceae bacterium]